MSAARRILFAVVVVTVAGVGGYGAARALSTDGPDPHVDQPVVVRPAGDSTEGTSDGKDGKDGADNGHGHRGDNRPGGDSHHTPRGDDNGDDDADDDSGHGSDDDFEPVRPTPNTFDDDDDDDDDSGHGSDDDRGDDDGDGD